MQRKSDSDNALWHERLEDDVAYFLSAEGGGVPAEELEIEDELLEELSSCMIFKTSGSSGKPKWVVHSKEALLKHAALVNDHLDVKQDDIFGLFLPVYHVGGLGLLARSLVSGVSVVSDCNKWSATFCVDFITKNEVSILSLVPTQIVDLVTAGLRCPKCVRVLVVGGGSLDSSTLMFAFKLGWPVMESYGMTETGSQIATGKFCETNYLRLIDGWQVRVSKGGDLEVKGDCLFKGYLEESEGVFNLYDPKVDGWFKTNDKVDLLENSEGVGLKFIGRSDQKVKILGELVDVSALENQLRNALGYDAFIVPIPDSRRGMKLFPVLDQMKLVHVISDLGWSGLNRLEEVLVVSHFPRNVMGKLQRTKLVEMVESIVFSAD